MWSCLRDRRYLCLLALVLTLGSALRLVGLGRGASDFLLPETRAAGIATAFYAFHPDEETLVRAALALRDPRDPPLTAYGMVPLYLLRAGLELPAAVLGADPEAPRLAALRYYVPRVMAVAVSALTLVAVWWLGAGWLDPWAGLLAAGLVAVSPLAIQQAHFYTVDGLYALLSLVSLAAVLGALDRDQPRPCITCGVLIGLLSAVRLTGLLLFLVLLAGRMARRRLGLRAATCLGIAGLTALFLLGLLQPYLILDPGRLWRAASTDDFGYSAQVASGELLRLWSLADRHTVPYLHYWTRLFPLTVGWPLSVGLVLGTVYGAWRRSRVTRLLLLWSALSFAVFGGLHTKHVRYLLPVFPCLCLLAADACLRLGRARRRAWLGWVVAGLLFIPTLGYGLAFSRLYTQEDSRLQAGRWMASHVPPGSRIGVERGAFSLAGVISGARHRVRQLGTSPLFEARGLLTCRAALYCLRGQLTDLEYLAITDVNLYQQFTSAPDLLPALAGFYGALVRGDLGFELLQRWKVYPALAGLTCRDDGTEPSFLAYDHPACLLLRRRSDAAVSDGFRSLGERLQAGGACPDAPLHQAAEALRKGDLRASLGVLEQTARTAPHLAFHHLLATHLHQRLGDTAAAALAWQQYLAATMDRPGQVLPWAEGLALVDLHLPDLAEESLRRGMAAGGRTPAAAMPELGPGYVQVANYAYELGHRDLARTAYLLSVQAKPTTAAYNRLAYLAYADGDVTQAVHYWSASVSLDDGQAGVHANLGQVQAARLGQHDEALRHLSRALELQPSLEAELSDWFHQPGQPPAASSGAGAAGSRATPRTE